MEIRRINFIEREPFRLTYQTMAIAGGTLVILGLLLIGIQWGRGRYLEGKVALVTQEANQLKTEREQILKELETRVGTEEGGVRGTLVQIFNESLPWSLLFRELTDRLPTSVWLTNIKSYEKPELPMKCGLLLDGYTEEASAVGRLVKLLSESSFFEKVVLSSFQHETGEGGERYSFSVDLALSRISKGSAL